MDDGAAPLANAGEGFEPAGVPFQPRPAAAPDRLIHLVGNSHLDLAWLWTWQEAYQEARATFRSALALMDEYPDFVFTCDQVVLVAWVEEQDPALFERIRERAAEGRWVNAGGWWVEPDCNLPSGESLARQGLVGQRYLASRFGAPTRLGMNVDPFGHAATIPQILVGQGIDSYWFLRPMVHELALPGQLFRWVAPDGSAVTAYRIPHEYQTAWTSVDRHVEKALAELGGEPGPLMIFFGVGNHGGGPTREEIETVHRFDRMGTFGALRLSSPADSFADALASGAALPEVRGDLQHHAPGAYSAHSEIKRWVRRAESALLVAERWAAVVALTAGIPYPREDLDRAWKQLLLNQFHDLLPGTAIEPAYDDARDQLGEATSIAKRITVRAHGVLASRIDVPLAPATQPVVVFNPHPWAVTADVELHLAVGGEVDPDVVTDDTGAPVPAQPIASRAQVGRSVGAAVAFRADLPPLGYRTYRLRRSRSRSGPPALPPIVRSPTHLEAERLTVRLDPSTGRLTGLLDKRTGLDLVAGTTGDHTVVCADPTDTWGHRVVSYDWPGLPMALRSIRVVEDGALRARVRVELGWHDSRLVEEFVLGRHADVVEVRVELDWRERAHLLKLRFPVAVTDPEGTTEIPYGAIGRPVTGSEEPGRSWVDLSGTAADGRVAGLALVNDAKHGYDVAPAGERGGAERSPSIGVTAVRSPVFAWHDPTPLDPDRDHAYQDQGVQRWTARLVPHLGRWTDADLHRRAAELELRPRAMLEGFHDGPAPASASFADCGRGPVLVTAVKGSEDPAAGGGTDLVVRALETLGRPATLDLDLPVAARRLRADLAPHALRTWRIPADPAEPIVEVDLVEWPLGDDGRERA